MPLGSRIGSRLVHTVLTGATVYCVAGGMDELLIYLDCKRRALEVAQANEELLETLGAPIAAGPWYNASVGTTHNGYMAHSTFPVQGSKKGSELHVTTVRKPGGGSSTLYYNTIGEGEWQLLRVDAMVSRGGGMARRMDLLHTRTQDKGAGGGVPH